jgi:methylase of polypeptide subunit release factors
MINWLKYCVDKRPLDCGFSVYFQGKHDGGGPLFINHIFGKQEFLDRHKDCKSVLELCSGPGFIGWYLYYHLKMDQAHFLDIHEPVSEDILYTASKNNCQYNFYLSDGFKNYTGPKVDLIVMNPPFYFTEQQFTNHVDYKKLTNDDVIINDRRITLDLNFSLHNNLIENFSKHLTKNGRIVFLEDKNFIPRQMIESRINQEYKVEFDQFYIRGEKPDYYTLTYYM